MAKKTKKRSRSSSKASDANVVRIKAGAPSAKKRDAEVEEAVITKTVAKKDSSSESTRKPVKAARTTKAKKADEPKRKRNKSGILKPFVLLGGYFKGSWFELRQVRWPTRGATWSLTGAVLAYTAFFVLIILALDFVFQKLFELILGK